MRSRRRLGQPSPVRMEPSCRPWIGGGMSGFWDLWNECVCVGFLGASDGASGGPSAQSLAAAKGHGKPRFRTRELAESWARP
eukprot:999450-Alexandrium_andersonii.AAC.1